jgi:hypothetical protein
VTVTVPGVYLPARTSNDTWGWCTRLSFDEVCTGRAEA